MSTDSYPVRNGTLVYIAIFGFIILFAWFASKAKMITKDSFQIIRVIVTICGLATWMLWVCAWMHQWHPLITPEWKNEH